MEGSEQFYACSCFFKKNIFIKKFSRHFTFESKEQFRTDYKQILDSLSNEEEEENLFQEIYAEIERRKNLDKKSFERKEMIQKSYIRLHPNIFQLKDSVFHETFKHITDAVMTGDRVAVLNSLNIFSEDKHIYGFQMMTREFCHSLLEELDHFEESPFPKGRPNSMNQHGVLLDELGFYEEFVNPLRTRYLQPLAQILYPELGGNRLDSHRAFIVHYRMGQDVELHEHFDNAEITLNICLGKSFTGGELFFGASKDSPLDDSVTYCQIRQEPGYAILHRGKQVHGALPLTSGERCNMIIWMRASSIRNQQCPMCNEKPDLIQAKGFGDGFSQRGECCVI